MPKGKKVFSKGGVMERVCITRNLPVKGKDEIIEAFNKMIKEQFADRDWT